MTISKHQIIVGDCAKVLPRMKAGSVDLSVFSPPYDGIRDYEGEWSIDSKVLATEMFRVTKDGGVCAVVIGDGTKDFAKSLTTFRWAVDWVDCAGWRLFECCIYQRPGQPGAWWNKRFRVDHEYILLFLKGSKPKSFNKEGLKIASKHAGEKTRGWTIKTDGTKNKASGGVIAPTKCRGTVWSIDPTKSERNKVKSQHPATFPDRLADDLIRCFSKTGDLVLDPMCGSGTTGVMATKAGRKFVGIEINPKYADIARRLISSTIAPDASPPRPV